MREEQPNASARFSRIFKEYTSTSFSEYLTRQRINRAVHQLGAGSGSITEIAYRVGFQSISTFNRVFRAIMGCSPREYRENYNSPAGTLKCRNRRSSTAHII